MLSLVLCSCSGSDCEGVDEVLVVVVGSGRCYFGVMVALTVLGRWVSATARRGKGRVGMGINGRRFGGHDGVAMELRGDLRVKNDDEEDKVKRI